MIRLYRTGFPLLPIPPEQIFEDELRICPTTEQHFGVLIGRCRLEKLAVCFIRQVGPQRGRWERKDDRCFPTRLMKHVGD